MPIPTTRVAAQLLTLVPRKRVSRALGRLAAWHAPPAALRSAVNAYVRAYGVDLSDAIVPPGGYPTFDAFFTRRLVPGARPLDPDERCLVSPADGRLEGAGEITSNATFEIKGRTYDLHELLLDPEAAQRFEGGEYAVVYLSPRSYHRVHASVTGRVTAIRHIGGTLFPVNSIGMDHVERVFAKNERVVVYQSSGLHGGVATVLVGAIGVGRISLSFDSGVETNRGKALGPRDYGGQGPLLSRGDELGVFHLGSTVILFTERGSALRWAARPGDALRMGQALARKDAYE